MHDCRIVGGTEAVVCRRIKWPNGREGGRVAFVADLTKRKVDDCPILQAPDLWQDRSYEYTWSEWYTGDTLKLRLTTDSSGTAFGFVEWTAWRREQGHEFVHAAMQSCFLLPPS